MSTPVPPKSLGVMAQLAPFLWGVAALLLVVGAGGAAIYYGRFQNPKQGVPVLDVELLPASGIAKKELEPLPEFGLPGAEPEKASLLDLEEGAARAMNAAVPFSDVPIVAARPFASKLGGVDRDRARTCLAMAAVYEAGSSVNDQRPVMQVILNRVRHPAFPNSVCAVVFQGAERRTGCQFTFACDGSLARYKPSEAVMSRANGLAEWMLSEGIDDRVGHATHYHTDWVVPYWSPKLNKVTQINTHIFLSWKGYWGQKASFRAVPESKEAAWPQLASYTIAQNNDDTRIELEAEDWAALNLVDGAPSASGSAAAPSVTGVGSTKGATGSTRSLTITTKRLALKEGMTPGRWALDASGLCGSLPTCRVVGWADPGKEPGVISRSSLMNAAPDLVFVQDLPSRVQTAHWDCGKWEKASTSQCLGSAAQRAQLVTGGS